ncbi:MAG: radical SAM protein [Candidatus Delongbacteria bacterium]|nr:radical SAM protein [Candidatus Delongbacteria bacterium]
MAAANRDPGNDGHTLLYADCQCCPRRCRVDRLAGQLGFCRIGARIRVSHSGLHFGEEPPITGSRGSGTVFLTGCNLRCVFCQNHQISQQFSRHGDAGLSPRELALRMLELERLGAHNINLVSPSHQLHGLADAIVAARELGLSVPIVYNSNGYDSVEALRRIRGLVQIYLPDLKYLDLELAHEYSAAGDYAEVVPGVLREMQDQVGQLQLDADGIAERGLLVRHLVLPGCVQNTRRCLDFLAEFFPQVQLSLMAQYSPQYKAIGIPGIDRPLSGLEYEDVLDHALELGFENAYIQELESQDQHLPDFSREQPFDFGETEALLRRPPESAAP